MVTRDNAVSSTLSIDKACCANRNKEWAILRVTVGLRSSASSESLSHNEHLFDFPTLVVFTLLPGIHTLPLPRRPFISDSADRRDQSKVLSTLATAKIGRYPVLSQSSYKPHLCSLI